MPTQRRMNLVAYLKTGPTANHPGGWRHPEADLHDIFEPTRYEHLARVLENARFDAGFFADTFGLPDLHRGGYETYLGFGGQITYLDPMAVLPLMARVTSRLGIGATLSTTFNTPYYLARTLASLDLLSQGPRLLERRHLRHRYRGPQLRPGRHPAQGRTATTAATRCWRPAAPCGTAGTTDALVLDREAGRLRRPREGPLSRLCRKIRPHPGPAVDAAQPAGPPRLPAGRRVATGPRLRRPLGRGDLLHARHQGRRPGVPRRHQGPHGNLWPPARGIARCCPRSPSCWVKPDSIAEEKTDYLNSLIDPELVLATNSQMLGVDLSLHEAEADVVAAAGNQGIQGSHDRVAQLARAENISFAAAARRQRSLLVGTAREVADYMEDWFTDGAADGFILWPTVFPGMFEEFGRLVVPELQRRGLFRTEYSGVTLRENLLNP